MSDHCRAMHHSVGHSTTDTGIETDGSLIDRDILFQSELTESILNWTCATCKYSNRLRQDKTRTETDKDKPRLSPGQHELPAMQGAKHVATAQDDEMMSLNT